MKYLTFDQIVDDIVSKMTDEDKIELSKLEAKDMIKFHHGVGTFIRNEYGLWRRDNPLTAMWFIDTESGNEKFINNGIDDHPNHPDAISMNILYGVWEIVTGKKLTQTADQIKNEVMNGIVIEINRENKNE